MEDFYEKVLDFVEKVKAGGRREAKARAEEAQQRIMSGGLNRTELVSELSVLFHYVGGMLYWRGYKDAEYHNRAINRIQRTPEAHKQFNCAVTEMLNQDIAMTLGEICAELERQGGGGRI